LSGTGLTQFGRALKELDIELICAHSPQAKGRVERANQTLQDRLTKELRLRGLSSLEAANAYLPEFMAAYNARFAVAPRAAESAHRPLSKGEDLERILPLCERRTLSKNLTLQQRDLSKPSAPPTRCARHMWKCVRGTPERSRSNTNSNHWHTRSIKSKNSNKERYRIEVASAGGRARGRPAEAKAWPGAVVASLAPVRLQRELDASTRAARRTLYPAQVER